MKKSTKFILIFLFLIFNHLLKNDLKAQTASVTITYTGFQACGGCTVCGADYWCFNQVSSYCGNTAACGTTTFANPVPAGNIVTNISISYYSGQCNGSSLTATINGNTFPTVNEGNTGCPCSSNPCGVSASTGATFPCGVPGYNNAAGGSNSFQLCTGVGVCVNAVVLTMTYVPANQASPATQPGAIVGSTPVCAGTPYTYTIPVVANAVSYTWTVPPGWTINSGQGSTTISATPGSAGNICVSATNLCGTSALTCYPVTLSIPSVAPTGAVSSPNPICAGSTSTLTVSGGTLGSGAIWNWYSGSCGGTLVGTGSSITVSPVSTTTYYVLAQGTCNTTACTSTTVTVVPLPPVANAGSNQSICGTTATLVGNAPAPGTGAWTLISGSGSITSPSLPNSGVTGLSLGANIFQWTISSPPCSPTSSQVTITVNPDANIALTSAIGTDAQTLCVSTAITNITYIVGGGGTGAGVTGLPPGVTGSFSGGIFTISGTPTSIGTYNYTITTTGTCAQTTASGTIIVNPDATIALSSVAGTDAQTLCVTASITNITYIVGGGGTGAGVTGLPPGVTGSFSGGIFTISGTPTLTGTFNYTVTTTGTCAQTLATGIIIVNSNDDPSFSYSSSTFCLTGIDPIATITGTTGGAFTITSPGVINAGDGTINLSASGLGTYTITYNTTTAGNPCPSSTTFVITITAAPGAIFSYNSPFCQSDLTNPLPNISGGNFAGVFSSNIGGLNFVSTSTGEINLSTSTPGTYMVYNNIAPAGGCAAVIDSFQIVVNPMYIIPQTDSICQGDSIMLGGFYQNTSGIYNDTLVSSLSCDSIIVTTLTVNPITNTALTDSICQGDSILLGGAYQTAPGIYNDTLTTTAGCDSVIVTTLSITPPNTISPNLFTPICDIDPFQLSAVGSGNGTITWYSDANGTTVVGTGSPLSLTNPGAGTYTYYVNEVGTCSSSIDSITVVIGGVTASINATPLTGAIPLDVFFGNGSTTGSGILYSWDFGDGNTSNQFEPNNIFSNVNVYTVMLIVSDGICSDTATIDIDAFGESVILIPNIFTPNGDGTNDIFTIEGVNLESVNVEIFNRWGQKMFSWNNVKGYWDGRTLSGSEAPDGTYFYIINAKGFDSKEYFKKGGFSLIK